MYERAIEKLYRLNMNLKKEESLLVFTDTEKEYLVELLDEFIEVAESITEKVKAYVYPSLKGHGKEPPEDIWKLAFGEKAVEELKKRGLLDRILLKEDYSEVEVLQILKNYAEGIPKVVVAFPYYSTTHTFFRKALTEGFGCRYASMPLFEPDMFWGPMDVDWEYVANLSRDVADILTEGEWVHVRGDGTDIEFSIKDRKSIADTGLFHEEGQYGNLPAGEAFVAPIETSAFGKLTITYGPDRKLQRPITLKFRNGSVEEIEGFEEYRHYLEKVFSKHERARFIAEFGVGTNPKAKKPDNVLEAEKILGTIHIAIGDNHAFGGINKVPFHTDYVVFEPQVIVGGKGWQKKLLEKGKLKI